MHLFSKHRLFRGICQSCRSQTQGLRNELTPPPSGYVHCALVRAGFLCNHHDFTQFYLAQLHARALAHRHFGAPSLGGDMLTHTEPSVGLSSPFFSPCSVKNPANLDKTYVLPPGYGHTAFLSRHGSAHGNLVLNQLLTWHFIIGFL